MNQEHGKQGRWWKKLAVMAAAFLVAALLAELVVTLVLGEQVKFPRRVVGADWGLRFNQPNATYRHRSPDVEIWFRINGQGMRADRDFTYEKPPGKLRVVSLGDSFTVGYEVEAESTFSSVVERELIARGHDVEVLNAGVSGFSTAEEYLYLERELLKYDPDLVLVSFYTNDLADNLRTNLFRLDRQSGQLVPHDERYVPLGGVANFLNTNPVLAWLSQYSNAFALLKEQTTLRLKRRMVEKNVERFAEESDVEIDAEALQRRPEGGLVPPRSRLACAIYERIYALCAERGIPLVVHSIPHEEWKARTGERVLVDLFPLECFDVTRAGLAFVSAAEALAPHLDQDVQLYWYRSHKHWTPFAHRVAGEAIAAEIVDKGLLDAR